MFVFIYVRINFLIFMFMNIKFKINIFKVSKKKKTYFISLIIRRSKLT